MWIDAEHEEMTLLVGKEKLKFDLHQNRPLMDEEKRMCMRIEILLPLTYIDAYMHALEDPL